MRSLTSAVLLLVALPGFALWHCALAQVPDESANKCVNPSSTSDSKDGKYYDACVQGASFRDKKEPFNFNSAYVKNSTFKDVTFKDSDGEKVDVAYAFWFGVTFDSCEFEGDSVKFDQAIFADVKFRNCVFKSRPSFSQITIRNTEFDSCIFEKGALFSFVDVSESSITDSKFNGDETLIEHTTSRGLEIARSEFNALRFQLVEMTGMTFEQCSLEEFNCHEELGDGKFAKNRAEFESVIFRGTELKKVSCDQTIWRKPTFKDIVFGDGKMDFSKSSFVTLVIDGMKDGDNCAELDMSSSNMTTGGSIANVDLCKFILEDARLEDIDTSGVDMTDKNLELKGTTFGSERIGDKKCCVEVCKDRNCKCDIPVEPTTGCPKGDSSTNVNIAESGCFPGSATVILKSGNSKRMDEVEIGDEVLVGYGLYSEVFMFTHRLPTINTEFLSIHTASGALLTLTSGHFLYVNGMLSAASTITPGSTVQLADGSSSVVTAVTSGVRSGLFNPQTTHGDVVVDGIITSTYTATVAPQVAHMVLAPLRALYSRFGWSSNALETGWEPLRIVVNRLMEPAWLASQ